MKVRNFIAYLNRNYSPDQEIMGFAIGSEFKEMKAELWEQAVEIWDDEDVRATFQDYINDIIIDAEIQLYQRDRAEEAVDSYLADLAEKEFNSENA
jgi:hypothetical protein